MVSSNKSIAKQVINKEPVIPTPIVEPIVQPILDPIVQTIVQPIVQPIVEPIVGTKPIDVKSITTDIIDASISKSSTTKKGSVIVGALDKGSFERVKKGSLIIPPLDTAITGS